MIIDGKNPELINTKAVNVHDHILEQLNFDRTLDKLKLIISKSNGDKKYTIEFLDVLGFKMTACDFWGKSPHILDFEYVNNCPPTILSELEQMYDVFSHPGCKLANKTAIFFETVMTFASGDTLRISCSKIAIH